MNVRAATSSLPTEQAALNEHTKTDGLPMLDAAPALQVLERAAPRNERMAGDKIECNACPVLCQISAGKTGACDRYANEAGVLGRTDPVVFLQKAIEAGDGHVVAFASRDAAPDGVPADT